MKHFIYKSFQFLSLPIVFGYFLFKCNDNGYITKVKSINKNYDIINFGTSHGGLIDYSLTNKIGISLNKPGNTLYYDLQNYNYIRHKLKEKSTVILPISYFSFGLDENRNDEFIASTFVYDFYAYLTPKSIKDYSIKTHLKSIRYKIVGNFEKCFMRIEKKNIDQHLDKDALLQHARLRSNKHSKLGGVLKKNIEYLDILIAKSLSDGHNTVLLSVPYLNEYTKGFDNEWLENNYFKIMDSLANKYKIQFLNYSQMAELSTNYKYFQNSDHLNEAGIQKFSERLFTDLKLNN